MKTEDLILKQDEMIDFFLHPSCNEDADLLRYNKLNKEINRLKELYNKESFEFKDIPVIKKPTLQRMITQKMIRAEFEDETNIYPVKMDYKGRIMEVELDYVDWLEFKLIDVSIKLNLKIKKNEASLLKN